MKLILQQTVERLRHFAMLLVLILCAAGNANALESDDINTKILSSVSTVIPKWETNDWIFSNDSTYLTTPSIANSVSTLTMNFTSTFSVDISISKAFDYYNQSSDIFKIIIDGEENKISYSYDFSLFHKVLSPGQHTIQFIANFKYSQAWARIKNVSIIEYKPLETSCVKDDSMPLTFDNDPDNPWLTYDGYIQSMDFNTNNSESSVSTTFTIDKPSLFSFQYRNGSNSSTNYFYVYIDEVSYISSYSNSWKNEAVVLYPGTHTVKFRNSHSSYNNNYYSQLRNVSLTQDWLNVTMNNPGELGVRVLQALGDKNLQDAEMVKIKGSLNTTDWETITQLTGVKAIDFTETDIASIPKQAFSKNTVLSTVMLPQTLTEIGEEAFKNTNSYSITIPKSVVKIDHRAWQDTPLRYFTFEVNSNFKEIGYEVFENTRLMEFDMPNSVDTYWHYSSGYYSDRGYNYTMYYSDIFNKCTSLRKLHLSDNLSSVPYGIVRGCTALREVNIPANATSINMYAFYNTTSLKTIKIPEKVSSIGYRAFYSSGLDSVTIPKNVSTLNSYAFQNCKSLKNVVLNSHCHDMNGTFSDCTALETVVLPCATPPTIYSNPFDGVTRSNVKLTVPDFALQSYKTDSYWYNFTNTVAGDEASISDYWALRGNLTLDDSHVMRGKPTVEMYTGSILTMNENINQEFNYFTYNNRESYPASYFSNSNNVKAENLRTYFYVETANKWFFFSPVCDVRMSDISYSGSDSWVIRYYDGERRASNNVSSGNWRNMPADGILHRGQGYIFQSNATGWLNMPVDKEYHADFFGFNEVTMPLAENPSENEANAGWNFIANPYPCYYDIYYIDMHAPITVWTGSTYRAYSLNDGDRGNDTFVLRPQQPFFVQKDAAESAAGMPLTGRRINTTIKRAPGTYSDEINPLRNLLNLELVKYGSDEAEDYTRIVINEQASMGYERTCDASKFMSMDATVAQFFSLGENDTPMAINERPYDNGNVALGVYFPEAGETFTITATRSDRKAWLYDAETGIEQDLTEGDYMFTVNKSGYDYKRFSIRFSPVTTAVEKTENVKVKVTAGTGCISVTAPEDANVTVYGTDGSMIASCVGSNEFNVAAGIYVIKVDGQTFKTIVK